MGRTIAVPCIAPWIALLPLLPAADVVTTPQWIVAERQVAQSGADWRISYRLHYVGVSPLRFTADETAVRYTGVVSNARCPAHSFPRAVDLSLSGGDGLSGSTALIDAPDPGDRCRELASVWIRPERTHSSEPAPAPAVLEITALKPQENRTPGAGVPPVSPATELQPGDTLLMTIDLAHEHTVCRDRDPLLGPRRFRVQLGPATFDDEVNLDRPHAPAPHSLPQLTPEASRCDSNCYHSPPTSLHLHAGRPRDLSYRFPSFPVHHGSSVALSFWYRASPDSRGTCRVRVGQYQDRNRGWTRLGDAFDEALPSQVQWTRFERRFTVRADATTLSLDFRFADGAGEAWIDDVEILPVTPHDAGR
jgi:hypothetical protein